MVGSIAATGSGSGTMVGSIAATGSGADAGTMVGSIAATGAGATTGTGADPRDVFSGLILITNDLI